MTRTIGICSSSRSERHLCEALVNEMNNGKYDLKAELLDYSGQYSTIDEQSYEQCDIIILPADRSELTKIALQFFHNNIPFCHYLAGSQSYSFTHDDVNRWLISLMANFCFAESPEATENLKRVGIPEDRILVTGTSHFDGITNYDIEANKPKDAPEEPYDLLLRNETTQNNDDVGRSEFVKEIKNNPNFLWIQPNEDAKIGYQLEHRYSHLEFLWLLHHADHFISNSSAGIYELPYLQKYYGSTCKLINPSQRNSVRTNIDTRYCRGASKIIAKWCETIDLNWLCTPKEYPYYRDGVLTQLPK